ncbi:MAG: DUF4156 domain-containing protein [Treponemataceae bacterium]|nr:DUF4156 domain-containing protein [Treponemataceae bacterium]
MKKGDGMRKILMGAGLLLFLLMVSGCVSVNASGTYLITGTRRKAIDADTVMLYAAFPKQYEIIGIVTATSTTGWTEQSKVDRAVAELKRQAAKIGANGVVVEDMGEISTGSVLIGNVAVVGNVYAPVTAQKVSGKAIYVAPETQAERQ